jgi:3-deoxy-D-manno-octulosonic-acid transferase
MIFLYRISLFLYSILIRFVALFNEKAKSWVIGRKDIFDRIAEEVDSTEKNSWFHFPSLGEFEQGRTVLERYKEEWPDRRIIITFYSPSGYEVRKNYPLADHVFYLPVDSPKNAQRFVELINPEMVFFIKYDYWFYYFRELNKRRIPLYLVSAIFRPNQVFFKSYGGFFRKTLRYVTHFFVQNQESIDLLKSIDLENASITGDTRFDRVMKIVSEAKDLPLIADFVGEKEVLVAGSTWPPDVDVLSAFHKAHRRWRIIIAPHDVNAQSIKYTLDKFPDAVLYSQLKEGERLPEDSGKKPRVLIIDNVGMLSSLYRYGDVTYIGGGFGKGIHNTLEAAAYGRPVIFGPRYEKFQEAKDLIKAVAAFPIKNEKDLIWVMERLMDEDFRINVDGAAKEYVYFQAGATERIIAYLKR